MNFIQQSPHSRRSERAKLRPWLGVCLGAPLFLGSLACSSRPAEQLAGPAAEFNLSQNQLALGGYDPLSYFSAGGQPLRGLDMWVVNFMGANYRFATHSSRERFLEDPESFAPAYGGWCAWAMVHGDKVDIDPTSYLIQKGRLLVFYDGFFGDTRRSWMKADSEQLELLADQQWHAIQGSPPSVAGDGSALGFGGNDPLALAAGLAPVAGSLALSSRVGGVEYRFATPDNRLAFLRDPHGHIRRAAMASER